MHSRSKDESDESDLDVSSDDNFLSSSDSDLQKHSLSCKKDVNPMMLKMDRQEETAKPLYTFKLCGDNIDKTVKRRYMHSDKGNLSLHYFHSYAVLAILL